MHKLNGILVSKERVEGAAQQISWTPKFSAFPLYLNFVLEYPIRKDQEN
jgi:hypothetical protein